ncbi:hypothetical protein AB0H28_27305 [Micromonospora sp. NPDC050980]|uniref:hypothetical protein n=1 Tax=Micromonospora sp. NPDC050980 TaxID=3155161 RepID=UPI0033E72592
MDAPLSSGTVRPSAAMATPSPSTSYRPLDALCARLDLRMVADLVGQSGDHRDVAAVSSGSTGSACAVTVGRLPGGVVVTVRADVGAPNSGRLMYEGLRQVQLGGGPVTELTGVGAAAYAYSDPIAGISVVTYDANLYLTVTAAPLRAGADLPDGLIAGLSATASSGLSALRA